MTSMSLKSVTLSEKPDTKSLLLGDVCVRSVHMDTSVDTGSGAVVAGAWGPRDGALGLHTAAGFLGDNGHALQ